MEKGMQMYVYDYDNVSFENRQLDLVADTIRTSDGNPVSCQAIVRRRYKTMMHRHSRHAHTQKMVRATAKCGQMLHYPHGSA